jgi:hypothetical protein
MLTSVLFSCAAPSKASRFMGPLSIFSATLVVNRSLFAELRVKRGGTRAMSTRKPDDGSDPYFDEQIERLLHEHSVARRGTRCR